MKVLTFTLILALIIGATVFGSGESEKKEIGTVGVSINYGRSGPDWANASYEKNYLKGVWSGALWRDHLAPEFEEETGIEVVVTNLAETGETIKLLDASLASNDPLDVVFLYGGNTAKYATERFTINFRDYLPDSFFDQFLPSALAQFNPNPDEVIRIIPATAWIVTGTVNADLMREIGAGDLIPAPDATDRGWTLAEFESMARKARDAGKYATYIAGSGGYDMLGWFGAFGAKLIDNGKLAINSPEGVKAAEYLKWLDVEQFAWPGAAQNSWGDSIGQFQNTKEIVFISGTPGRGNTYFDFAVMEYPHAPGVETNPIMSGADAWIVFDNRIVHGKEKGEAKIQASIELIKAWTAKQGLTHMAAMAGGRISPFQDDPIRGDDIWIKHAQQITEQNGIFDMAMGSPYYSLIRRNLGTALQAMFTNEKTPKEALDWMVAESERQIRY